MFRFTVPTLAITLCSLAMAAPGWTKPPTNISSQFSSVQYHQTLDPQRGIVQAVFP